MACFSPKLIIRIIDDSYKIKCPYVLFVDPSIIQTGDTTGTTTADVDMMTPTVNMDTVEEDEANNNKPDKSADVHTGDVAAFITIVDNAISDKRSATGDMVPVDVDATIADADITADIASMTFRRDNEDNSREFFASLKQHLDSGQHCDFTMKTDQGAVHCHKLVLSASGSLFQNVFDRISRDRHSCGKIAISKVVLGKVLAWLYYSDITIDETCIEELMIVCGKWKLIELLYTCGEYMSNNMNVNNACWFFRLSRENGIWKVAEKCSYFIREHYEFMHNTKQLEKLTLKQFCNIISNEEINVTNENIVYDSILRLLQTRPNIELLSLCYQSVRLKKLTPRYLISKILNHTRNVQRTDDDMEVELTYEVGIRPRYWDSLLYINKNQNLCEYDTISCKWVKYRSLVNGRVDPYTAITATNNRMVIVGGESSREVTLIEDACSVVKMPELPTQIPGCGVSMAGNYIFIVGGQTDINSASCWNSVYEVWIYHRKVETLKPMNHGMASPLVATCRGTLYVIGGINSEDKLSNRRVQALDLIDASADWKVCADLPQGCNNTNSGFVIYEYRLLVLTTKYCMTYDDLADSWSVKQYECQGDELKPVVYKNNIWALVKKDGKHCVKCYCRESNEWKIKIDDVPDVLYTASAMVERSQACNTFHQLP